MEREQIIKALECCTNFTPSSCDKCPFEPKGDCYKGSMGCNDELMKNALSLIKELAEENERLKAICGMKECVIENAEAVIARTKADTVRKMQERLKEMLLSNFPNLQGLPMFIDQIAKEIIGEEK